MKKNIYELLNEITVREPEHLIEMTPEESDRIRTRVKEEIGYRKPKRFKKIAVAAVLVLTVLGFTGPGQKIYGKISDFYQRIVNPISTYAIDGTAVKDSVISLDKTVEDRGISLTAEEYLLEDNLYLNITSRITDKEYLNSFEKGHEIIPVPEFTRVSVNGRKINADSGTIRTAYPEEGTLQMYYFIHPYTPLKKGDRVTLSWDGFQLIDYTEINWETLPSLTKEDLEKNTLKIPGSLSVTFSIEKDPAELTVAKADLSREVIRDGDGKIIMDEFRLNPYRAVLSYHYEKGKRPPVNIIFIAEDERGKTYRFDRSTPGSFIRNDDVVLQYVPDGTDDILKAKTLKFQGYREEENSLGEEALKPFGKPFNITIK